MTLIYLFSIFLVFHKEYKPTNFFIILIYLFTIYYFTKIPISNKNDYILSIK